MRSNTYNFAARELDVLLKLNTDPENRPIIEPFINEILELVDRFGKSGQSGGSAPFTASALSHAIKKLCLQEPICPVTGADTEWGDVTSGEGTPTFQNTRCHALFKEYQDGKPYYLDAIVWKGDTIGASGSAGWDTFTGTVAGISSRQFVKGFPFTPKTFYVDVTREKYDKEKHGEDAHVITTGGDGDVVYFIKDQKQLDEVFEYYDRFEK